MSWIETGQLTLPKDLTVAQIRFHQGSYFFRSAPRWQHKTYLFRWDAAAKSELWKMEISDLCVDLSLVGSHLLLRDMPAYGVRPRRSRLYTLNPQDGTQLWSNKRSLRTLSVSNDRIYTVEKTSKKPFLLVCYNGDTGKAMRSTMMFEVFKDLWANDTLLIGHQDTSFYATDLSGEPLDQIKVAERYLSSVGPDGSVYYYENDPNEGHLLYRWQPQTKELWNLSTGELKPLRLLATSEPGLLLYSQPTKQEGRLRFILYDWAKAQSRWEVEAEFGHSSPYAYFLESPVGFLVIDNRTTNFFLHPRTGALKSFSHTPNTLYHWVGERLFLQKKQNLIALAWKH